MRNIFIVSLLISFAMICSCQKQDSAAEQQLAQRKAELDAREKALDERMDSLDERVNSLDQRVKELAEREQGMASSRLTQSPDQVLDPAQEQAEREKKIQQVRTEMLSLMPDSSKMKTEKDGITQERRAQSQSGLEKLQSQKQRKLEMSVGAVFPAPDTSSPTPSPAVEAASATPTATPQ